MAVPGVVLNLLIEPEHPVRSGFRCFSKRIRGLVPFGKNGKMILPYITMAEDFKGGSDDCC